MDRMASRQQEPLTPTIQASANNISKEHLDCGIKALGWCSGATCQKLAHLKSFVSVLAVCAALQGAVETYFRISAKQAALDHGYDPTIVSWLLVTSGILQAVFALLVSFGAQKYHPIAWLGGLSFFQCATALGAIIPTLTHYPFKQISATPESISKLCSNVQLSNLTEEHPFAWTTLVMLFILQFGIALTGAAIYVIGVAYIDDNSQSTDSPALIGIILASKIWGSQLGSAVSLGVTWTALGWWLGWVILLPFMFTLATLISLFPRKLLNTVVKQAAFRIMEVTTNTMTGSRSFPFIHDVNFLPTLRRLLTNKVLMLNLTGLVFFNVATVNFFLQEPKYLQSRFFLPTEENNGLTDEWLSRFLSYLLRPPTVGLCILVAGLIISKLNPNARSMTVWNISAGIFIVALFIVYIPLQCSSGPIAGTYRSKLSQPFCSRECICSPLIQFSPICPENSTQTYFSPCHAGCRKETVLNGISIYDDCTCGEDSEYPLYTMKATEGACNAGSCQLMWIIFQILTVLSSALLGTTLVSKLIISLRAVLPQDKSFVLGLELFLTCIMTYAPGKLVYDEISRFTCHYWSDNYDKCHLHDTPLHGNVLNSISAGLALIGVIFDVLVLVFVKDLEIYPESDVDPGFTVPLYTTTPRTYYTNIMNYGEDDRDANDEAPVGARRPLMEFNSSPRRNEARPNVGSVIYAEVSRSRANGNNDVIDFRLQTSTDTTLPESSVRSISPDTSDRSDSPYIKELRNKMDYLQRRRLTNRLVGQETAL